MSELLLLSNSRAPGQAFLEHAADAIRSILGGRTRILFVPFASGDPAAYAELMRKALGPCTAWTSWTASARRSATACPI
jgi:dipeptidase E